MDAGSRMVEIAREKGFERAASLPVDKLRFSPEFYRYCEENLCGNFGVNWACPRAPGDAEHWNRQRGRYGSAVLVQSHGRFAGTLAKEDYNALEAKHHWNFLAYAQAVRAEGIAIQGFSVGRCLVCQACTCPDAPCRHPEQCFPSISGVGLNGEKLCALAGLPYGNFQEEVTFLGLLLAEK